MGKQNYTSFNIYQRMGKAPDGVGKFDPKLEKAAEQGKLPANFASKVMENKANPKAVGKMIPQALAGAVVSKVAGKVADKLISPNKSIYAKNHNMFSKGVSSARAGLDAGFKTAEQAGKKQQVPPPEDTNDENKNKENKGKDLTNNINLSGDDTGEEKVNNNG